MSTVNFQTSEYAIPVVSTKEFEEEIKLNVQYAMATGRWDKIAPLYGHGSPGIGKSALAESAVRIVEEITGEKAVLSILDAPQIEHTEAGYVVADINSADTEFPEAKFFRNSKYPHPESESIHVFVIEELSSASPSQQVILHPVLLDRRLGPNKLPKRTIIFVLGNLVSDKGHVIDIMSPVANRCKHMIVTPDLDRWLAVAMENGIDPEITAFHRSNRGSRLAVSDMKAYGKGNYAFFSPRAWFAAHESLAARKMFDKEITTATLQGHVGATAAIDFIAYRDTIKDAPTLDKIFEAKENELAALVPATSSDTEANARNLGLTYYLIDSLSQYMVANNPDMFPTSADANNSENKKSRERNAHIWKQSLLFMKEIAAVWGNSIAVIGIINIRSKNSSLLGCVARFGTPDIVAWLGSGSTATIEEYKVLKNMLLA
ncbi:hypothetical protein D3C78_18890 [compost metagenome]